MRRALILIIGLSVLSFGAGFFLDTLQHDTAAAYLRDLEGVRQLVLAGDVDAAAAEESYIHARWQHDAGWLNCLISHHHTRAVNAALLHLSTALAEHWPDEALLALDEAHEALTDIQLGHLPVGSNIL